MQYSTSSNDSLPVLAVQHVKPAAALAANSGSASRLYQTRRGSFMILVVGTLALLAVITILYVGIGRSDRQLSAATVRNENTERVPDQFKDYAAQVIADGAVSIYEPTAFANVASNNDREFYRKTWDYPSTDWKLQTYVTDPTDPRYFTPSGGRTGTTPFLASNDPTHLNFLGAAPLDTAGQQAYKRFDDWYHISNFAPDGAFVNLYNMRIPLGAGGKGFDAAPADMRKNLFLVDATGRQIPGGVRDFGTPFLTTGPYAANPADMTMRQAHLFREKRLDFVTGATVDSPDLLRYAFDDVDGDGLYDSRIFEMREWRDPTSPEYKSLLPQDQTYRWYFAVKCVDLSGMVNVNTATDNYYQGASPAGEPGAQLPVGVVPAEVDLMRVLTHFDNFDIYNQSYATLNNTLLQDPNSTAPVDTYQDYSNTNFSSAYDGRNAFAVGKEAYDWTRRAVQGSLTQRVSPDLVSNYRFSFPTPLDRYVQYLGHAGRPGELGAFGPSGSVTYSSSSGFKLADQIELMKYRGINSPEQSRLEALIDGRPHVDFADARLSPLRSNRSLFAERDYVSFVTNPTTRHDLVRYQSIADIRHNLTVVSGARDLHPGAVTPEVGYVPPALSSNDLKIDAQGMLAYHDAVPVKQPLNAVYVAKMDNRGIAEHSIFMGYANALCPALPPVPSTLRASAWAPMNNGTALDLRTRFYGYGSAMSPPLAVPTSTNSRLAPELPIYMSAFMAVGVIDSFDDDKTMFMPPVDPMEDTPTVKTVLISDRFRNNLMADYRTAVAGTDEPDQQPVAKDYDVTVPNGGGRAYPWAHWVDPGRLGQFDLNGHKSATGRLYPGQLTGTNGSTPIVPAVNVYGIEAQPFISQVASLIVYTDTPSAFDGDLDQGVDADNNGMADTDITIKGDLPVTGGWTQQGTDNCDVLCRAIAFQLSNPFDHDIVLSYGGPTRQFAMADAFDTNYPAIDRERDFYYIEYCNNFFKLAEQHDESNASGQFTGQSTLRQITVPANGSIVVYALNRSAKEISDRWTTIGLSNPLNPITRIRNWMQAQFGGDNANFYQMPRFEPAEVAGSTGRPLNGFVDIVTNNADNRFVHLWRAQRAADFEGSSPNHEGARQGSVAIPAGFDGSASPGTALIWPRNARENDRLVDRFVAPEPTAPERGLARKLPDGQNTIVGAHAGNELDTSSGPDINGNTGVTIMLWTTVMRPDDGATVPAIGVIPPWCVEPKMYQGSTWNVQVDDNMASPPDYASIRGSAVGGVTLNEWFQNSTAADAIQNLKHHPWTRTVSHVAPVNVRGQTYRQASDELFLANNHFQQTITPTGGTPTVVSTMRLADMLKPLCMGPFETPVTNSNAPILQTAASQSARIGAVDRRWVTLSQVLAVAYGFDPYASPGLTTSNLVTPSGQVLELFKPIAIPDPLRNPSAIPHPVQVAGHIVIDDFVPFKDAGTHNRLYDVGATEYRAGLGVPLAMNILDNFSMTTSLLTTLNKAKPGTINLNTATRTVLSAMPVLSPPPLMDPRVSGAEAWWWWKPDGALASPLDTHTDIVATLMSYRDKIPYQVRKSAFSTVPNVPNIRNFNDGPGETPDSPTADGRDYGSGIAFVHEDPGLRSVGELLAARMRADSITTTAVPPSDPSNIDFRRYLNDPGTTLSLSRPGVASVLYRAPGSTVPDKASTAINSFSNQVDLANAVYTSTSVRSDYFAVYFTIQGYQRSDVENLGPTDPMIPSIRRRYLMIVDRSNVQRVGDKPRILAFKELPIN